jgi:tetratricopeptide (TPR) repeat protein
MSFVHFVRRHGLAIAIVNVVVAFALALAMRASASPLDDANRTFAEGHFADAAARYEAMIAHDGYSAPVLFDLGNAYLRADQPARAMLAYERARLLAPRDAAIATNLAEARKAAGVTDERNAFDRAVHVLTRDEWGWIATLAFWCAVAAGTGAWLFPRRRAWLVRTAAVGGFVAAIAAGGVVVSRHDDRAALALKAAPVLVSPFEGAQSSFVLRAGGGVEIQRAHGGYLLVHDRQGRSGWVERGVIAPLVPDGGAATLGG